MLHECTGKKKKKKRGTCHILYHMLKKVSTWFSKAKRNVNHQLHIVNQTSRFLSCYAPPASSTGKTRALYIVIVFSLILENRHWTQATQLLLSSIEESDGGSNQD